MAEVLLEFDSPVTAENGKTYMARACASEMDDGGWQGWIEFLPTGDGEPVRSGRETTQPNREDTMYWATGLTLVFLEGALRRALNPLARPIARDVLPPIFDSPAARSRASAPAAGSVLDPFSAYRKGEPLLRRQLSALSDWHLVNIIAQHRLSDRVPAQLGAMQARDLVELIIDAVRERSLRPVL